MCTYRIFNPNTVNRYFSIGCDGACKGCCNSQLKDWNKEGLDSEYVISKVTKLFKQFPKLIDRIIFVGGDPTDVYLYYENEMINFLVTLRLSVPLLIYIETCKKDSILQNGI